MKSLILSAGCFVIFVPTLFAQKINISAVPAPVISAFNKMYPGRTGSWEKEKGNFEAGLKSKDSAVSLLFSPAGQLMETENAMAVKDLPLPVLAYVHKRYPGHLVKEAAKLVRPDGSFCFEAEVKGKDLIFNAAGDFLRIEED